jgi:hypothetical protein
VYDAKVSQLWGWQDGAACAFRNNLQDAAVQDVIAAADVTRLDTANMPTCSGKPTPLNSVTTATGVRFGLQNGQRREIMVNAEQSLLCN